MFLNMLYKTSTFIPVLIAPRSVGETLHQPASVIQSTQRTLTVGHCTIGGLCTACGLHQSDQTSIGKDSANRIQNKISLLVFYVEAQPILSKYIIYIRNYVIFSVNISFEITEIVTLAGCKGKTAIALGQDTVVALVICII